jgi:mono/diheme cytochrome c family protein
MTHFPVAMLIAAFLFELGAVLFKKPDWRPVSFWLLVTAVVTSAPSLLTGWMAGGQVFGRATPSSIFMTHRLLAFVTAGIALAALLWRIAAKDKFQGAALAASLALSAVLFGLVSYTGYLGGEMTLGDDSSAAESTADRGPAPAVTAPVNAPSLDPALVAQGKDLYAQNGCSACHKMDGAGGRGGPNLSHEGSRQADIAWQIAHLKDPAKMKPGSDMPAYNTLPDKQLQAIAQYLVSKR